MERLDTRSLGRGPWGGSQAGQDRDGEWHPGPVGPGKDCSGVRPGGVWGSCVDACHSTTQAEVPWLHWSLFECTLMGKEGKTVPPNEPLPSLKPVPAPGRQGGVREGRHPRSHSLCPQEAWPCGETTHPHSRFSCGHYLMPGVIKILQGRRGTGEGSDV